MNMIPAESIAVDHQHLAVSRAEAGPEPAAKRDNSYFSARLECEHPAIWTDYRAGRYASLRAACIEAGLIKPRKRSNELKNAWRKAGIDEKIQFLKYLKQEGVLRRLRSLELALPEHQLVLSAVGARGQARSETPFPWRITVGGRITPEAKALILEIMHKRGLIGEQGQYHVGVIMQELGRGFKPQDPSLSHALKGGWRIRPELSQALEQWVMAHYPSMDGHMSNEGC